MTRIMAKVEITPEILAERFWEMNSEEQAEFFVHLSFQGDQYKRQMQWWYLHDALKRFNAGKEALMDLAAPFYLHVLREWRSCQ